MVKGLTRRRKAWMGAGLVALAAVAGWQGAQRVMARGDAEDAALGRARRQVKMLDDLYKTAVVSITKIYDDGPPAVRVAQQVFKAMEDGEHHSARLVDATGSPLNEKNRPATEFEKRAEKAMQDGQTYYEEVVGEGDERRLMAATVVPAVLPRCAKCHGVEAGNLLGFLRYDVKVE